jgi:hypothetical protein
VRIHTTSAPQIPVLPGLLTLCSTYTLHPLMLRVSFLYSSTRSLDEEGFQKTWEHSP